MLSSFNHVASEDILPLPITAQLSVGFKSRRLAKMSDAFLYHNSRISLSRKFVRCRRIRDKTVPTFESERIGVHFFARGLMPVAAKHLTRVFFSTISSNPSDFDLRL